MKIKIDRRAWQKICAYVDNCPYEIGGLGQVVTDGTDFYVSDAEIFTQKVTPAHVDMTAETLATFQYEKMKAKQSLEHYKFWWHSHAKMGVFFSQTDTDTIDSSTEFPWLVSIVTNHKHELIGRVDIYTPVHMFVTNVTVEIMDEQDQSIVEQCLKDIAEKVTFPSVPSPYKGIGFSTKQKQGSTLLPTTLEERIKDLEEQSDELEDKWVAVQQQPKSKKRDKRERLIVEEIELVNKAIIQLKRELYGTNI